MPDVRVVVDGKFNRRQQWGVGSSRGPIRRTIRLSPLALSGEPRGPLCGMGICFECRLTIDGVPHARSCQIVCRDGMVVTTT